MERLSKYIGSETLAGKREGGAAELPSVLAGELSAVYCSDLSRAVKSAEIIAKPHGLEPVSVKDLRERNFGVWEGLSFEEIEKTHPREFKAWAGNPLKFSPVQGERTIDVKDRASRILHEILDRHVGEAIAVVAHGGINRVILCELLGVPLNNIFRIEQDFGALNIIDVHDGVPVIRLLNHVCDVMKNP